MISKRLILIKRLIRENIARKNNKKEAKEASPLYSASASASAAARVSSLVLPATIMA